MQLINSLELVNSLCKSNDYAINTCFTYGEFDCLKHTIERITLDTSARNKYVKGTERVVWTVKDRICAIWSGLPFTYCHPE